MKNFLFLFVMLVLCGSITHAADSKVRLDSWKAYSTYSDINAICVDNQGRIWNGASGGISIYDPQTDEKLYLNTDNGLLSPYISALVFDSKLNIVIAGASDGAISIIDMNLNCKNYSDIKRMGYSNAIINDIKIYNSKVFIAGAFGVAAFDMDKGIFVETITKIGSFSRNTNVSNLAIIGDTLWIASDAGIAKAKIDSKIQNPASWSSYTRVAGNWNGAFKASKIIKANNSIFAAIDTTLLRLDPVADSFRIEKTYPYYAPIKNLFIYKSDLYISNRFNIFNLNGDNIEVSHPKYSEEGVFIQKVIGAKSPNGEEFIAVSYRESGFGIIKDAKLNLISLNSPLKTSYPDISIDSKGRLWAATGNVADARGVNVLDENENWNNFISDGSDTNVNNKYYCVSVSKYSDKVYAGNWGGGFTVLNFSKNAFNYIVYNAYNSPLTGPAKTPFYAYGSGLKEDNNGNLWIANPLLALNSQAMLVKMDSKGEFTSYPPYGVSAVDVYYQYLTIDFNNTKWLGSAKTGKLIYFNEKNNNFGEVNSLSGANSVYGLTVDQNGVVWVATDNGLFSINRTSAALSSAPSSLNIRKNASVSGKAIKYIHVDAINNKWLATNEGVWVLSSDGSEVLEVFNTDNTPMKSNKISSICSDYKTGKFYFSTESGLYSALSLSVEPGTKYDASVYPQPFNPEKAEEAIIDGLMGDNDLTIVTSEGRFVKRIKAKGGKAVWDGRDESGDIVDSGVYLALISNSLGDDRAVAKIALMRKK
jgi:streptogramin lyase